MTRKQAIIEAIEFRPPPYVPWAWGPTQQCAQRLQHYLGCDCLDEFIDSHFLDMAGKSAHFIPLGDGRFRDAYGVVWDRTVDADIGSPEDWPIKDPADLRRYKWPDADDESWYAHIPPAIAAQPDLFSRYTLGFSLYERAWTMRGMSSLLMDMVERPSFVEDFLDAIVEHNLVQIRHALACGVDAVHFGDDYGMQTGLIMGIENWRRFFKPRLARMFEPIRKAGKFAYLHSCGAVSALFDDLVEIGLNIFNPFQPEVMDVFALKKQYQGRLAFHGGLSIQKTLPFGSPQEVRAETHRLIEAGMEGGYIFSPSHGVPRDVPPENLVAMMEVLKSQPEYNF